MIKYTIIILLYTIIILLIVTLFNLYTTLSFADDTVPNSDFQIYSAGSVLMDASTGKVLLQKDSGLYISCEGKFISTTGAFFLPKIK